MKAITQELFDALKTVDDGRLANAIIIIFDGEENIVGHPIDEITQKLESEIPGHNVGLALFLQLIELDLDI